MSGPINSVAEIALRLAQGERCEGHFDQRPGELEATRGLGSLAVVGARSDGQGWKVALLQGGEIRARLAPAEARELAREILEMSDICDGGRW